MKKIKFNKLTIKNFRNINELEINFNDTITEIIASNGKGKTNTISAVMWCLFGKDINDNKQFTISPIINGEEDNSINTIVKLVLNDNYIIERSYCKRITSLKTGYIIDGKEQLVSTTQTQFQKELTDNFVDEETFKSLSNINYIPNLHWKDLKKLIFDLIGDIKNEEILLRDDFLLIEEYINRFGIDQTQKLLGDTDKELNDDIKRLETEYQTLINTKEKYVNSKEQNIPLENRKKEIENILYNDKEQQKLNNKNINEYRDKKQQVSVLKEDIERTNNSISFNKSNIEDYNKLYEQNGFNSEIIRQQDIASKENELSIIKRDITNNNLLIEQIEKEIESLKVKGNELKSKEIKIENDTCNYCGQKLPEDSIKLTLSKLKEKQEDDLKELKSLYENKKEYLKNIQDDLATSNSSLESFSKQLEEIKSKEYTNVEETDKQKQIRVAREEKEIINNKLISELKEKEKILDSYEEEFAKIKEPNYECVDSTPLRLELDDINNKLATSITLVKISEDIEETLNNLNVKKDNKITNKEKMQQVIKFNNIKADLLKQKIRNYFKVVDFKVKEFTNDGQEQETFKICNDKGIEWKDINSGHKILLGVDLLQGIMKAKDIYLPLIIDNGETLTNDIEIENTQLIITKAVKGIESIEVK